VILDGVPVFTPSPPIEGKAERYGFRFAGTHLGSAKWPGLQLGRGLQGMAGGPSPQA